MNLPNFLHLGPSKTGSTWLHETLSLHPEVYLSEAKDLYYFSRYYERGLSWYRGQFRSAGSEHKVVGEVSPDYLMTPDTPERIRECLGPRVRLMVTLRDPAERAFSSYLYMRKQGQVSTTFREACRTVPHILGEGRYGTLLGRFLPHFGPESIHLGLFDELESDPQRFLDETTEWLGISPQALTPELSRPRLPASDPRWLPLTSSARRAADLVRRHDGARLVGRVKRSSLVQRALYRPLGDDRPMLSPADLSYLRQELDQELSRVEEDFGLPLRSLWGWS